MRIAKGLKKRIHINKLTIARNKKHQKDDPPIAVRTSKGVHYGKKVSILGPSQLVYQPEKPLPCGAQVWIETSWEVVVHK